MLIFESCANHGARASPTTSVVITIAMLAETPPIAVEEGNRSTGISCEEIGKFDADERGDDVKSIAEHLNQCGRLTKKEHVAIIIAVRRCRQNPVGMYVLHRAAMRLLARRESSQEYNILEKLDRIDVFFKRK